MTLYHLLPAKYALDDLRQRRLKIAQIEDLNDPFELMAAEQSDPKRRRIWSGWKESQAKIWGMLCFSRTWRNPVLWSHYAEKHQGICLGFEVNREHHMSVRYRKKRPRFDAEDLYRSGKLDGELMARLMSTKFTDWSYEREVRVFATLDDKDPDTGLFYASFSQDLRLTTVIAGPLCPIDEATIRSHLQPQDQAARVFKSRLGFQSFEVVENKRGFPYART